MSRWRSRSWGFWVFAVYIGLWLALIVGGHSEKAHYTALVTGWTIGPNGHGHDLYDIGTQTATQQAILGGRSFEAGLNPFNNPPHLVVPLVVPGAAIPMATSYLVWCPLQVGLLAWLVWRLWSAVSGGWTRQERVALVAVSFFSQG